MELDSFEVIREGTTPTESLTTTIIDDLTKAYDHEGEMVVMPSIAVALKAEAPTAIGNEDDVRASPEDYKDTSQPDDEGNKGKRSIESSSEECDDDTEEPIGTDTSQEFEMMDTLIKSTISQQSSIAALIRDRAHTANAHLSSLISTLSTPISTQSKPITTTPIFPITPRTLTIVTLLAFTISFTLFLVHTLLFSQMLANQQTHYANITGLERAERMHHIEKREELRGELMHGAYERARVREEEIKICNRELRRSYLDVTQCREKREEMEKVLGECKARSGDVNGKVRELRRHLAIVKKEHDRLKGMMFLGGIAIATWILLKFMTTSSYRKGFN